VRVLVEGVLGHPLRVGTTANTISVGHITNTGLTSSLRYQPLKILFLYAEH
jgi:hypothetical protein